MMQTACYWPFDLPSGAIFFLHRQAPNSLGKLCLPGTIGKTLLSNDSGVTPGKGTV